MGKQETVLVGRATIERILTMERALEAVERAFRLYGEGRSQMPPKLYLDFGCGDLRCMPAFLPDLGLAAVKNVNVHPANRALPTVMATLTLFDPRTGFPLAFMDATCITRMRTGASGGIAARYMARPDARVAAFVGAGTQAHTQFDALMLTRPSLREVVVYDLDPARARAFADRCAQRKSLKVRVAASVEEAVRQADILTTTTPSRRPAVCAAHVRAGAHINAIGADAPGKQEIESEVLRHAIVVVDNWEQASHSGEINVPVTQGLLTRDDLRGDIGQIVTGRIAGRDNPDQITLFDSTGLAIQDLACAAAVWRTLEADAPLVASCPRLDLLGAA